MRALRSSPRSSRSVAFVVLAALSTSAGCTLVAGLGGDYTLAPGEAGADAAAPLDGPTPPPSDAPPPPPFDAPVPPITGEGRVLYSLRGTYLLLEARAGATPVAVEPALNQVSPGRDTRMNLGADGSLVVETSRFGCSDPCLAVFSPDLKAGERVLAGGGPVTNMRDVVPAVAGNGALVVFGGQGPHSRDLYESHKTGSAWSAPALLTGGSDQPNNFKPSISSDGSRVLFDCGPNPFGSDATGICEVGLNGSGFRRVIGPEGGPGGGKNTHSPSYGRDGTIVFEGEWSAEQIWRIPPGASSPVLVNGSFSNDNTPCVLPNGKVASLWLQRPGNPQGFHELKIMNNDGTDMFMLLTGVDVDDIGLGCGN
ncbi:MAG: hypothetical protein IPF92_15415 [Myxococcales bacterium]|nr:hypothetical protein [Myxococcales bacterium]MBL0195263.1 hypothetical protein [Myxococcales bacterium]HQY60155.1 hypothetical protein [Polyangiaceae bacterium]